jgi:hypothetical protein
MIGEIKDDIPADELDDDIEDKELVVDDGDEDVEEIDGEDNIGDISGVRFGGASMSSRRCAERTRTWTARSISISTTNCSGGSRIAIARPGALLPKIP